MNGSGGITGMRWVVAGIVLALFGAGVALYVALSGPREIANYPSAGTDIVAFGDSLVYGTGSTEGNDFVSLLSQKIGQPIVNLGVPGNTTADGLARLDQLDQYNPKVVILLLGGNDYLKHVPADETFANLGEIIKRIQSRGSIVLLLGIKGGVLGDPFAARFRDLRDEYNTAYVSDVLDGLITKREFMSDAIHPNDAGYVRIAGRIYPVLSELLK